MLVLKDGYKDKKSIWTCAEMFANTVKSYGFVARSISKGAKHRLLRHQRVEEPHLDKTNVLHSLLH